jgi:hypothetical protein
LLTFEFMDEIDSPNIDNKVDEYWPQGWLFSSMNSLHFIHIVKFCSFCQPHWFHSCGTFINQCLSWSTPRGFVFTSCCIGFWLFALASKRFSTSMCYYGMISKSH